MSKIDLSPCGMFIVVFMLLCCNVIAQQSPNHDVAVPEQKKEIVVTGFVIDSATLKPMGGSVVTVICDSVATNYGTDSKGQFEFKALQHRQIKLELSFLGYKITKQIVQVLDRDINLGRVKMAEDRHQIDVVEVRTRVQLFKIRGDTVVYNTAAVRSMQGDVVLDVLTKMPGLDVSATGIKVMGESVQRTYVNGKLVFGDEAMNALNFLDAKHVTSVKLYDEVDPDAAVMQGAAAKKRKVLNIITRKPIKGSLVANATAMGGADFNVGIDGRQKRYGLGGGAKFFCEKRQASVDYMTDNVGMNGFPSGTMSRYFANAGQQGMSRSDGYQHDNKFKVSYSDKIKKWRASANYSYGKKDKKTAGILQKLYFPTSEYTSRIYADTSRSTSSKVVHQGGVSMYRSDKNNSINIYLRGEYGSGSSDGYNGNTVHIDQKQVSRRAVNKTRDDDNYNVSMMAGWSKRVKKSGFQIGGSSDISHNGSSGWRVDTLATSSDKMVLKTTSDDDSYSFGGNTGYSLSLGKRSNVMANYDFKYLKNASYLLAIDQITGQVDPTVTRKQINNNREHTAGVAYFGEYKNLSVRASANYNSKTVIRDEQLPRQEQMWQPFRSVDPSLSLNYTSLRDSVRTMVMFSYRSDANAPSLDQLRDVLDTEDPLNIFSGNPDLKQSRTHWLRLNFDKMAMSGATTQMLSFSVSASVTENSISQKRKFFAQREYLPQYKYYADAGTTLTTYQNIGGKVSANADVSYNRRLKALQSMFTVSFRFGYDRRPTYILEQKVCDNVYNQTLALALVSNVSDNLDLGVNSSTGFSYNHSSDGNINRVLNQSVTTSARWNFLKKMYVDSQYAFTTYRNYSHNAPNVNRNLWNASIGCYFQKNRRGSVSVSVYDILNGDRNFSSRVYADYVSNSWKQIFSRYFMVNFSYRFNKVY